MEKIKRFEADTGRYPYCIVLGQATFRRLCDDIDVLRTSTMKKPKEEDKTKSVFTFNGITVVLLENVDVFIGLGEVDISRTLENDRGKAGGMVN